MPHITVSKAVMNTLDEKTKEDIADASPAHALFYKSATKSVI